MLEKWKREFLILASRSEKLCRCFNWMLLTSSGWNSAKTSAKFFQSQSWYQRSLFFQLRSNHHAIYCTLDRTIQGSLCWNSLYMWQTPQQLYSNLPQQGRPIDSTSRRPIDSTIYIYIYNYILCTALYDCAVAPASKAAGRTRSPCNQLLLKDCV